jgi:membrane-bound lytic murein transglycosylase A
MNKRYFYWGFCALLSACAGSQDITGIDNHSAKDRPIIHATHQERVANHIKSYTERRVEIYNRHLEDIKYEFKTTKRAFVAIGEKLVVKNKPFTDKLTTPAADCTVDSVIKITQKSDDPVDFALLEENEANCVQEISKPSKVKFKSKNVTLQQSTFNSLKDWNLDNFDDAMESLMNSCKTFTRYVNQKRDVKSGEINFGSAEKWNQFCLTALDYAKADNSKAFFEEFATPFAVKHNGTGEVGKFTGYYEFGIEGSLTKSADYPFAIYKMPQSCKNGKNCPTRKEINDGVLNGKNLEICYVKDQVDIWRMQVQGSGIIELEDGNFLRVSFGGSNGKSYKRIWDFFDVKKALPAGQRDAISVMAWLRSHPKEAVKIMNNNPSYTFFLPNNRPYAIGTQLTALTPSRSVAIDPEFIPYGAPLWIETKAPVRDKNTKEWIDIRRLVVAQDTGSAITGVVRADMFYGHGSKATYLADNTRFPGKYYLLLPNSIIKDVKIIKK